MAFYIKADNVSVIRNRQNILYNVSLTINEGDFTTIVGPNGAGKSMLLKCLMNFYKPDKGTISRKPGLTIGYVPQRLAVDYTIPITVQRFLTLRKETTTENIQRIAREVNIERLLENSLLVLSGGELQRVLLARALLSSPALLILDEPAQNLDVQGQLAFYKLLEQVYKDRNLSILMVSHDLHLVMASTKKVICLFHHICCSGIPQAVTKDPEFISLFGHDTAQILSVYQHTHDHNH